MRILTCHGSQFVSSPSPSWEPRRGRNRPAFWTTLGRGAEVVATCSAAIGGQSPASSQSAGGGPDKRGRSYQYHKSVWDLQDVQIIDADARVLKSEHARGHHERGIWRLTPTTLAWEEAVPVAAMTITECRPMLWRIVMDEKNQAAS
jgi:hypothetical protein